MNQTEKDQGDISPHPQMEDTHNPRTRLNTTWNSLMERTVKDDLTATPLTTGLQLAEETEAMSHAVFGYVPQCADGRSRIFTISRSGKKEATVEICLKEGRWTLNQVVGPRFRHPPTDVERFASELPKLYQKEWRKSQPPKHASRQDENLQVLDLEMFVRRR